MARKFTQLGQLGIYDLNTNIKIQPDLFEFLDDENLFEYTPKTVNNFVGQYIALMELDKYYKKRILTTDEYNKIKEYLSNDITLELGKQLLKILTSIPK